jgi:transcriptional regulator with XRE-family HTH domain
MKMQEILRAYRLRNGYTQGQFAKILNIHRNTVANYESGRTDVPEMVKRRFEVLDKKEERTNEVISNTAISDNQKDYLIELQREKIERLESRVNENISVYDGIQSDIVFSFEVKFNWSLKNPGVKVKYLSQDSSYIPTMAKKLGYTEAEIIDILQIDEMVDYKNHKIHQLRTEKQKEEMISIMDNFMNAYRSIKMNTTMLVAEIPVLYTHKNGTVFKANVEYRVNWVNGSGTAHIRWCAE